MELSDIKLRHLTEPKKHFDGAGLYLEVTLSGGKYWRMKYRYGGKEKRLAFGTYPQVKLKEARERADDARRMLRDGIDPGVHRKAEKLRISFEGRNSLETVANDWMEHQSPRWIPTTRKRIRALLKADVFPQLGGRPLASIKPRELMIVLQKIEARGSPDQSARALQHVKGMYRWAVTHGRIELNPMTELYASEIFRPREKQHRLALADRELPEFFARLNGYEGSLHTRWALSLLMLTAVRPGEVTGAMWSEFDLESRIWTIPAQRMKMRTEHRVPLSQQAVGVLKAMQPLSGTRQLVFPSPFYPSKPLSANTFMSALTRMGYKGVATAHGFRALFSSCANAARANDARMWDKDVIERQLSHLERGVRGVYNRATLAGDYDYIHERAKLMQWWADYLDARKSGEVIPFFKRVA